MPMQNMHHTAGIKNEDGKIQIAMFCKTSLK